MATFCIQFPFSYFVPLNTCRRPIPQGFFYQIKLVDATRFLAYVRAIYINVKR